MDKIVTSKVNSHRFNQNYNCLLYEFVNDPTFHTSIDWSNQTILSLNWMPKESDVLEIVNDLMRISPTFSPQILDLAARIQVPTRLMPKREIRNLAEVLL